RPGDAIGVMPYAWQPVKYYLHKYPDMPIYGIHFQDNFNLASRRLNEIASQQQRLWVVSYFEDWSDPSRFATHALDERSAAPPVEREFPGLRLTRYDLDRSRAVAPVPTIGHPAEARFANGVTFKGWDVVRGAARPGETGKLDLHWQ